MNDVNKLAEMVSDLSHDLRTPLTTMRGFSELLLDDQSLSAKSRDYAQLIAAESRKISDLLLEFLMKIENDNPDVSR